MNRIENPLSLCAGCNHYLDAKCSGKNDPGFSSCTAYKGVPIMMFPKPSKKKKNKRLKCAVPDSIKRCSWSGRTDLIIENHHVYAGNGKRELSNFYRCVCWLHYDYHRGCKGGIDPIVDLFLKAKFQFKLEWDGMSRSVFLKLFDQNYLYLAEQEFGSNYIFFIVDALEGGIPKDYYEKNIKVHKQELCANDA